LGRDIRNGLIKERQRFFRHMAFGLQAKEL
jgi:hypothetical protein